MFQLIDENNCRELKEGDDIAVYPRPTPAEREADKEALKKYSEYLSIASGAKKG